MKTLHSLVTAPIFSTMLLLATPAGATTYFCGSTQTAANSINWTNSSPVLQTLLVSFTPGSANRTDIQQTLLDFLAVPRAHNMTPGLADDDENNLNADENEIYFLATPHATFPNRLGSTYLWYQGICGAGPTPCCVGGTTPSKIVNADIEFYWNYVPTPGGPTQAVPWVWGMPQPLLGGAEMNNAGNFSFRSVAAHEYLHAFGLDHNNLTQDSRMANVYPNGGWPFNGTNSAPFATDIRDLNTLYPSTSVNGTGHEATYLTNVQSLPGPSGDTAVALSWDGPNNQQNVFPRNQTPIPGFQNNWARAGHVIDVRVCMGSRTTSTLTSVPLAAFLTTSNILVETSAVQVGSWSFNFPPTSRGCFTQSFTLPSSAVVTNNLYNVFFRIGPFGGAHYWDRVVPVNRQLVVSN